MTAVLSLLFSLTLFLNAFLLFFIQPMFAKMILPLLGGAPQVWNTCMMFFQIALLAGYAYAHAQAATMRLPKIRMSIHLGLMLLALWVLPIRRSTWMLGDPPVEGDPTFWLLGLLLLSVGLPFLMVSAGAPLLQNWFSKTKHPDAKDPYFLYAASNLGSLAALLVYPLFFEPNFTLQTQSQMWTWTYAGLIALIALCGFWAQKESLPSSATSIETKTPLDRAAWKERLYWIALAFVPSSWMLGVTTYISTDIAAIPLLWVIPLSLYLLSFVIAFSKKGGGLVYFSTWFFAIAITPLITMNVTERPQWLLMPWNLICFFIAALMLHGELARRRPPARQLTEFYLWLSVGGMLGGVFNALLAPILFNSIVEYPMMLILASLIRPIQEAPRKPNDKILDFVLPAVLGLMVLGLTQLVLITPSENALLERFVSGLYSAVPVLLCFSFRNHRIRFALGLAVYLAASLVTDVKAAKSLHAERTFFGVHRVTYLKKENRHNLIHGRTVHGYQSLDPETRREPLGYYHRESPIGQVLEKRGKLKQLGFIGLGAGTLAAYGKADESWTFFEIDPEVKRIAENPKYFSYLKDGEASYRIVMGDARLTLQKIPYASFDLLVIDAFSSDSIPVHLMTQEAVALYFQKIKPSGLLMIHISNRYLDLEPVVGGIAERLGLLAYVQYDKQPKEKEEKGFASSRWMMLARSKKDLARLKLESDKRWQPARSGVYWTDSFSNIVSVYHASEGPQNP